MKREERANLALDINEDVNSLKDADFKFLIRTHNLTPVGLITSIETEWISSIGDNRKLAKGIKLNGSNGVDKFEEYLDWYNPSSGEIEDCVCMENGVALVTARDGFNIENSPDNFTWLTDKTITKEVTCDCIIVKIEDDFFYDGEAVLKSGEYELGEDISPEMANYAIQNGFGSAENAKAVCQACGEPIVVDSNFSFKDSRELRNIRDTMEEIKRERNDIRRKMKKIRSEKKDIETEAKEKIAKMDDLEEKVGELQEKKKKLKRKVDYYEGILPEEMSKKLKEASESEEKMQRAEEKGRFEGMDKLDQAKKTLKEVSELKTREEEIKGENKINKRMRDIEKMISGSLEEFEEKVGELSDRVEKVNRKVEKEVEAS